MSPHNPHNPHNPLTCPSAARSRSRKNSVNPHNPWPPGFCEVVREFHQGCAWTRYTALTWAFTGCAGCAGCAGEMNW